MEQKKIKSLYNALSILTISCAFFIFIDLLFIFFISNETKTIQLLKQQLQQVQQDNSIVSSSEEILSQYQEQIKTISDVFPNDETILTFIQILEQTIRGSADEYAVKFASLQPIIEQDKLFLLLTISMKTDIGRLKTFLSALEQLPYMTHITSLSTKMPDGPSGVGEVTIELKVYVQNPFSAK